MSYFKFWKNNRFRPVLSVKKKIERLHTLFTNIILMQGNSALCRPLLRYVFSSEKRLNQVNKCVCPFAYLN